MRKHCSGNILSRCCSQCCMGEQTGRKKNIFCFQDANSVLRTCYMGTQTTKQRGNIENQCFFNVSQMHTCLHPYATYVEDKKICILKARSVLEKFFASWMQFCFCNNVSLAFSNKQETYNSNGNDKIMVLFVIFSPFSNQLSTQQCCSVSNS